MPNVVILTGDPPTSVGLDWLVQSPSPIRRPVQVPQGAFVGQFTQITPSTDWWQEQYNPTLRKPPVVQQQELASLGNPITPPLDWFQQQYNPVLRKSLPVAQQQAFAFIDEPRIAFQVSSVTGQVLAGAFHQYQAKAEPVTTPVAEVAVIIDWLQQHPSAPLLQRTPEGSHVIGDVPIIPSFAWYQQETAVTHLNRIVLEGGAAGGFVPITPAPIIFLDWYQQYPGPQQIRRNPIGESVSGAVPITPSFAWNVPQPDVVRRQFFLQQGGASFVDPQIVSFSWHVPQSDLTRSKFLMREGGETFVDSPIIPSFAWQVPQADVARRKFFLQQGGSAFTDPQIVPFSWEVPQSDLIRRKFLMREGGETFVDVPRVSFSWVVPQSDLVRRTLRPEGTSVGSLFPITPPIVVFFDWFQQQPDRIPRKLARPDQYQFIAATEFITTPSYVGASGSLVYDGKTIQAQGKAEPLFPIPAAETIFLNWYQQHPDPLRRKLFINEGGEVFVDEPHVAAIDWNIQEIDLVRRKVLRIEGGETFVDTPKVSFSWHVPQSDLIRRPKPRQEAGATFVQDTRVVFEWNVQQADLVRRKTSVRGGGEAFVESPRVVFDALAVQQQQSVRRKSFIIEGGETFVEAPRVIFEWSVQGDVPVRELEQTQEGLFTTGFELRTNFEWNVPQTQQFRRPVQPRFSAITEIPNPGTPGLDSWHPSYQDILRPPPPRQYWNVAEFRTETGAELITFDKWWMQHFNPMLRQFRPPSNVVMPPTFFTPGTTIVFVLNPCLEAWQFFENSLLPISSGFIAELEQLIPSSFVAPSEALLAPSGWVRGDSKTPWNLAR